VRVTAVILASALLLLAPAAAQASAVRISRGTVFYSAAPGEANIVEVAAVKNGVRVRDRTAPLLVEPPCRSTDGHAAVCRYAAVEEPFTSLVADLGDGHDSIRIDVKTFEPIAGIPFAEWLPGVTVLRGGAGDDVLVGGAEINELDGGPGNDRLAGGSGEDTVSYRNRVRGVTVDMRSGLAGEPGERDTLTSIDIVVGGRGTDRMIAPHAIRFDGGPGDDVLIGSPGEDEITGQAGDDRLRGGGGADLLIGDNGCVIAHRPLGRHNDDRVDGGAGRDEICAATGADRLRGGQGADWIQGGRGRDRIDGGAGADQIDGRGGRDRVDAGPGRDEVRARDGFADFIHCGPARDRALLDFRDRSRDCELTS
jgi:Ca2+-binding RTX toxin-like protein